MFTKTHRTIAAAAAASIALTAIGLAPASAQPRATEVGYRHDGGAAALAGRVYPTCAIIDADLGQARDRCAFAAIAGPIAMIAASHHDDGPYYGSPYGYAPAPYGYAPRHGGWGGWHGHWHHR